MVLAAEDRMLVWCLSDTNAYTLETCDWYTPKSFGLLQLSVAEFIRDQLDGTYADFSEWFNLAEFPDVGEHLDPGEMSVYLEAAGADGNADVDMADDCFAGLRGVISHRLEGGSLQQTKRAAELFNWTIECGLSQADANVRVEVRVGRVEEVAPLLIDRILHRLQSITEGQKGTHDLCENSFERSFAPLAPVLELVKATAESAGGASDQLALKILAWIVALYKAGLENEPAAG
jgi:hypothetical protein